MKIKMNEGFRESNGEEVLPPGPAERTEFGLLFRWDPEIRGWVSTERRKVIVLPPFGSEPWRTAIPHLEKTFYFEGEDVEERAFVTAEVFSRQKDK